MCDRERTRQILAPPTRSPSSPIRMSLSKRFASQPSSTQKQMLSAELYQSCQTRNWPTTFSADCNMGWASTNKSHGDLQVTETPSVREPFSGPRSCDLQCTEPRLESAVSHLHLLPTLANSSSPSPIKTRGILGPRSDCPLMVSCGTMVPSRSEQST